MNQFNYEIARKARIQLGLTQKDVANDLNRESQGLLSLTNLKLSRYERGDSALDNMTQELLHKYYETKLEETNAYEPEQNDKYEPAAEAGEGQQEQRDSNIVRGDTSDDVSETQTKKKWIPSIATTSKLNPYDLIRFDPKVSEQAKSVLFNMFNALSVQLENALESPVERSFFGGVSEQTIEDARACIYSMAGLYNIIRALQGKPVLPIAEDSEKLSDDDILSVVQENFKSFTGQGPNQLGATG